jgi:hypothetical protein
LAYPGDPSDLDIVVGMPPKMLEKIVVEWLADDRTVASLSATALGGYRVSSECWALDIWTAEETVGVAKGRVTDTKNFRAVARSAALSLDSIVVTSRGTVYESGFFATVETGILRMNHCLVERPHKVAEKALRLCEQFRLVPDISVHALMADALGDEAVEALLQSRSFSRELSDVENRPPLRHAGATEQETEVGQRGVPPVAGRLATLG